MEPNLKLCTTKYWSTVSTVQPHSVWERGKGDQEVIVRVQRCLHICKIPFLRQLGLNSTPDHKSIFSSRLEILLFLILFKSEIELIISQVLQADGGNYTTCVNAAMLALVDAGIPLKDTVVSCTASLVKNVPLVDVNHVEQSGGSPELVVSILPQSGEVLSTLLLNDRVDIIVLLHISDSIHVADSTLSHGSFKQRTRYCYKRMQRYSRNFGSSCQSSLIQTRFQITSTSLNECIFKTK